MHPGSQDSTMVSVSVTSLNAVQLLYSAVSLTDPAEVSWQLLAFLGLILPMISCSC